MFQSLDDTLRQLLDDLAAPPFLRGADVSFETPNRSYAPQQRTVNLFLHEVKENRELRDPVPIVERVNGTAVRRRAPMRVLCSYLVTAWAGQGTAGALVSQEHRLLAEAFAWLSQFPALPESVLQGALAGSQPYPPPAAVGQLEDTRVLGEFWSALGTPPRAAFALSVTIAMPPSADVTIPLVTAATAAAQDTATATQERRAVIGGTVRDAGGAAVPRARVRLEHQSAAAGAAWKLVASAMTDPQGLYVLTGVPPGVGYRLRVTADGLGQTTLEPLEVPSLSGDYDVSFP
jgi:hypothetical protein